VCGFISPSARKVHLCAGAAILSHPTHNGVAF